MKTNLDSEDSVKSAVYAGVRVTVTGGTGFLGGHLARRLVSLGAQVTLLVRDLSRLDVGLRESCRVVQGDLLDAAAVVDATHEAAYVFHCAANVSTWGRWEEYYGPNVQGVGVLLDALASQQQTLRRLIHVSSVDVYGFPQTGADESSPTPPFAFSYGESKRQGEALVRERCDRDGISYVVLRPCNMVGPGSPFVSRIGEALTEGMMLKIDDGHAHAGLLDIENLLNVLLWAGTASHADKQVFNVRDAWNVSWHDFIEAMRAGMHGKGWVINLSYRQAKAAANVIATLHRMFRLRGEPLLHPLIVEIFGKTCGHSIDKLARFSAPNAQVDFASSLEQSIQWFLKSRMQSSTECSHD